MSLRSHNLSSQSLSQVRCDSQPSQTSLNRVSQGSQGAQRLPEIELQLLAGGNSSRGWVHSLGKGTKLSRCVSGSPNFGPHFCVPPRTLVRPPARGCTGLSLRPSQAQVSKVEPTPSLGLRGPLNHPCPGCSYCVESHHWDWQLALLYFYPLSTSMETNIPALQFSRKVFVFRKTLIYTGSHFRTARIHLTFPKITK